MAGLQAYLAFSEAVKHGSFAAAGREMGMSASAIGKAIGRLEADLGIRLFHRTTRQISLTSDGHALHERCKRITDEIDALREEAAGARTEPCGLLRVNAPLLLGRKLLVPALAEIRRMYPQLAFEVTYSDNYVDLIKEGLDAVIRIGQLRDSSLVARQIGEQTLVICASPAYLKQHGTPRKPADISQHQCMAFRIPTTGTLRPWQLKANRKALELKPPSSIVMNDGEALVAAAVASMGLVQVPGNMAQGEIDAGRLLPVLTDYQPASLPISVVYASQRRITPRLRVLIDMLTTQCKRMNI